MADKRPMIVIKKITVAGAGHHGGGWKVALADFMTAMMAFFLVMWLLGQSADVKKAISDYFSTPSVIEYNFQNYGAEVTLEKLFLDLMNEPLKAVQQFLEPIDRNPNLLDMGSQKVVASFMAEQLGDYAKNVSVTPDGFDFDIPDTVLFEKGSSKPLPSFVNVMDKLKVITIGLADADIKITSGMFLQAVADQSQETANRVASQRLDLIQRKVAAGLENNTVGVKGSIIVKEKRGEIDPKKLIGFIRISIRQREFTTDGKKTRKLEAMGDGKVDMTQYNKLVNEVTGRKEERERKAKEDITIPTPKFGVDKSLKNPVEEEFPSLKEPTQKEE